MKQTLFLLLILLSCSVVKAQELSSEIKPRKSSLNLKGTNELRAGWGYFSAPEILFVIGNSFESDYSDSLRIPGVWNFSFQHFFSKAWAVSFNYSYEKMQSFEFDMNHIPDETYRFKINTVMMGISGHYVRTKYLQLYSGLALGASFVKEDGIIDKDYYTDRYTIPAFQVTPLGLRAGNRVAFFAEIFTFGTKGAIHGGISLQL